MTVYLLAHGSPDPRHAEDVARIAARLARRLGTAPNAVRACFLDHCGPTLAEAADSPGIVLPLLLSPGYHVQVDVGLAIAAAGVPLACAPPPLLTSAAPWSRRLLDEVVSTWPGHHVVMVGAGTRDPDVLRAWAQTSYALGVPIAQASGPGPRIEALGAPGPAVAVPLLIARGVFSDRIAVEATGLGLAVAQVAGSSEALVDELLGCLSRRPVPAPARTVDRGGVALV